MSALRATGLGRGSLEWSEIDSIADGAGDGGDPAATDTSAAVAVASILEHLVIDPAATHCSVVSRDGSYSASIPLDELRDGGWLAYALDGKTLTGDLGGPLRLTVRQGTTLCWNVKDVGELRFTAGKEPDSVPEKPTH